jgi:hypothetical protein
VILTFTVVLFAYSPQLGLSRLAEQGNRSPAVIPGVLAKLIQDGAFLCLSRLPVARTGGYVRQCLFLSHNQTHGYPRPAVCRASRIKTSKNRRLGNAYEAILPCKLPSNFSSTNQRFAAARKSWFCGAKWRKNLQAQQAASYRGESIQPLWLGF